MKHKDKYASELLSLVGKTNRKVKNSFFYEKPKIITINSSDGRQIQPIAKTVPNNKQQQQQQQFCQPQTVGQRSNQQQQQQHSDWPKKVFCFYDFQDDFRPQDLNPCLCTHVVYSYVAVRKNLSFIAGRKGK